MNPQKSIEKTITTTVRMTAEDAEDKKKKKKTDVTDIQIARGLLAAAPLDE